MLDIYDSEAMVKVYRLLGKKCEAIDRFINNHALYFASTDEYSAADVYDNIINLMVRKNRLINLKLIIDKCIGELCDKDKQILYLKMNYNLSMTNICSVLNVKERTAFRRLEHAYTCLTQQINNSTFAKETERIIRGEEWIDSVKEDIKEYRLAFKDRTEAVNSL